MEREGRIVEGSSGQESFSRLLEKWKMDDLNLNSDLYGHPEDVPGLLNLNWRLSHAVQQKPSAAAHDGRGD